MTGRDIFESLVLNFAWSKFNWLGGLYGIKRTLWSRIVCTRSYTVAIRAHVWRDGSSAFAGLERLEDAGREGILQEFIIRSK